MPLVHFVCLISLFVSLAPSCAVVAWRSAAAHTVGSAAAFAEVIFQEPGRRRLVKRAAVDPVGSGSDRVTKDAAQAASAALPLSLLSCCSRDDPSMENELDYRASSGGQAYVRCSVGGACDFVDDRRYDQCTVDFQPLGSGVSDRLYRWWHRDERPGLCCRREVDAVWHRRSTTANTRRRRQRVGLRCGANDDGTPPGPFCEDADTSYDQRLGSR